MDLNRNRKLNRLVNIIYSLKSEYIYFSSKQNIISEKEIENAIKIKRLPIFECAETLLCYFEKNNIEFKETNIKIVYF